MSFHNKTLLGGGGSATGAPLTLDEEIDTERKLKMLTADPINSVFEDDEFKMFKTKQFERAFPGKPPTASSFRLHSWFPASERSRCSSTKKTWYGRLPISKKSERNRRFNCGWKRSGHRRFNRPMEQDEGVDAVIIIEPEIVTISGLPRTPVGAARRAGASRDGPRRTHWPCAAPTASRRR